MILARDGTRARLFSLQLSYDPKLLLTRVVWIACHRVPRPPVVYEAASGGGLARALLVANIVQCSGARAIACQITQTYSLRGGR
jgi:hypothetical protein